MCKRRSAYQLAVSIHGELGLPVFPVRLSRETNGKWQKQPLAKWSRVSGDPEGVTWHSANAVGVPMGRRSGLIAIDVDDYKPGSEAEEWLERHGIANTRIHRTASGGRHFFFVLPDDADFSNRAPEVVGIDIRGNGGFVVWADVDGHYSVVDDRLPAPLPHSIRVELERLNQSKYGFRIDDDDLPPYVSVRQCELLSKLNEALNQVGDVSFLSRYSGSQAGLNDKSRSAMDMSMAGLLADRGFSYSEIVQILLVHFAHGTAARDGYTAVTERAAMRCAARAICNRDNKRKSQMALLRRTLGQIANIAEAQQRRSEP